MGRFSSKFAVFAATAFLGLAAISASAQTASQTTDVKKEPRGRSDGDTHHHRARSQRR